MRILYVEGERDLCSDVVEWMSQLWTVEKGNDITDLIATSAYTDKEFDVFVIGENLRSDINDPGFPKELQEQLKKLENCEYFPVTLGKICKELCKKRGKKEPEIVIFTTFEYYHYSVKECDEMQYITKNHMYYVNKRSIDVVGDIYDVMERIKNK